MRKDTRFFNWLNGVIFFKNGYITKESYDMKRAMDCKKHKAETKASIKRYNRYK